MSIFSMLPSLTTKEEEEEEDMLYMGQSKYAYIFSFILMVFQLIFIARLNL